MARKGNQQRNGLDRNSSNHKTRVSDSGDGSVPEEKASPSVGRANKTKYAGEGKTSNQKSKNASSKEKLGMDSMPGLVKLESMSSNPRDPVGEFSPSDVFKIRGDNGTSLGSDHSSKCPSDCLGCSRHGLTTEDSTEGSGSSNTVVDRSLGASALSILKAVNGWLERQRPLFTTIMTILSDVGDRIRLKIEQAYPIVLRWLVHFGNLLLIVSMVWLDCSLRGLVSFLRLGTTSFFAIIWCSVLSVIAMVGISKFLMITVVAALVAFFVGFTLAILVIAISATVLLWMYGSFWTTGLVFFVGGLGFALKFERFALLITTVYSVYCAKTYVGWLGLLLGLNLSFVSSDVLIHFLKNNMHERGRSSDPQEQGAGMQGQSGSFYSESFNASGRSMDHSSGVPSTSGDDAELTSGDEVVRLLNCTDHYSALGLSRYENIDVTLLKREYRRKAMLVHPDKNMGNEKAAEAFKKLQNAYEVLLDSLKRKAYDDELKREELLNWFRRFQSTSQKNGRHNGFTRPEVDGDGDSRRIACKKCGNFHTWVHTSRSKSQARWCQDCGDFHQAKDGDGWVEQSLQPLFFGLLQKVDAPSAYVCAESRIYNATEWFVCQGMRCPANTHKPSFHVNTSVVSKHGMTKGSGSGQRGSGIPTTDMEEIMTEEEFFEWLQKAMQSGMFEATGGSPSTESPPAKNSSGKNSSGNKKKKGKKQW